MRLVLALAVWLWLGSEGRAQSPKAAEEAFEKGRALMAAMSYAEACAAFELSQHLDPQYGTQFNLAGCYAAQDKIMTAWRLYLELARSDTNLQRRRRSEELADQLAKRLPKLRIRVDQHFEGLKVVVGATDVTVLVGTEIPFDVGHYTIEARLPGYRPFREEIDVPAGGRTREIEIVFERELGAGAPSVLAARPPPSRRARVGEIAALGGGGLIALGLVAGWRALENRDASRERCNAMACPDLPGAEVRNDRARLWGNLSTAAVALGAVGVAGGGYLWRTASSRSIRVGATAAARSGSVVVAGTF
jgi:tetratricopeptide (TPR) repeat protein